MEAVTKTTKTIEEIIGGAYCPLPINVIPNNIGINLVSVESISWTKQEDGQLVSLTINFLPNTLTTMKKQTAVEYLVEQLESIGFSINDLADYYNEVQIALEMEKEQNEYFFNCGRQYQLTGEGTFKQVHNETYGGNNE